MKTTVANIMVKLSPHKLHQAHINNFRITNSVILLIFHKGQSTQQDIRTEQILYLYEKMRMNSNLITGGRI